MPFAVPDQVLRSAAAAFDLDPRGLRPLRRGGASDGVVFPCRRAGRDLFFKIKPIRCEVGREHDRAAFVAHLHASGVAVPQPVASRTGADLVVVEDGGTRYAATLTVRVPGRHIEVPGDWSDPLIRAWGHTLGRLHAASAGFTGGARLATWRDEVGGFRDSCRDPEVGAVWDELAATLAALPSGPATFGVVHNDLHLGNLMLLPPSGGPEPALAVLDFDVANRHWYAMDVAIALAHPIWDLRHRDPGAIGPFVEVFLEAYGAGFPLTPAWAARLPLFMRYRMTLFVLAMTRELGHPERLPAWLAGVRTWVLSGEPIAHLDL